MLKFLLSILALILPLGATFAANPTTEELNLKTPTIKTQWGESDALATFIGPVSELFFMPKLRDESVINTFLSIAFALKNFFIAIAVIFLIIGVLKLLFSWWDEEDIKKWRRNIIWTSIGIVVMQIATSVWRTLYLTTETQNIDGRLGWQFWSNIFEPLVNLMLILAGFGFLLMMVYAFYIIVTGGGDEEKLKKWKNIVIYAVVGFLLVRTPKALVTAIYGKPVSWNGKDCDYWMTTGPCVIDGKNIEDSIGIFGKILSFVNGFIMLITVALVIYAGWLVLISAWDEEKLKKAKNIALYIVVGLVLLVAWHALFRFFVLRG